MDDAFWKHFTRISQRVLAPQPVSDAITITTLGQSPVAIHGSLQPQKLSSSRLCSLDLPVYPMIPR